MRILHTSDWHIGRSLHGTELLAEQEAVLSGLADVVRAEQVDAVLVAGDVYDRAVPSADATAVLSRVLTRLRAAGLPARHARAVSVVWAGGLSLLVTVLLGAVGGSNLGQWAEGVLGVVLGAALVLARSPLNDR